LTNTSPKELRGEPVSDAGGEERVEETEALIPGVTPVDGIKARRSRCGLLGINVSPLLSSSSLISMEPWRGSRKEPRGLVPGEQGREPTALGSISGSSSSLSSSSVAIAATTPPGCEGGRLRSYSCAV
jgi:hypothetical protein